MSLETVVDQMGFFATLSQTQQLGFLMETLDELDTAGEFVNEIVAAWRRGDFAALDQQVNGQLRESRVDGVYDIDRQTQSAQRSIQGLMQRVTGSSWLSVRAISSATTAWCTCCGNVVSMFGGFPTDMTIRCITFDLDDTLWETGP